MIGLFDAFIASIIYYSCEVWEFLNSDLLERLHRKFLKTLDKCKVFDKPFSFVRGIWELPASH